MAKKTFWDWALTSGLSTGIGKKKGNGLTKIDPLPYTGAKPFSASEVGLGADAISPLATQYLNQIKERSQGQGLVGFDPAYSAKAKENFLIDLNDQQTIADQQRKAQASSQGLRGGVPLTIATAANKNYENQRTKGLNNIDIADLQARREDINSATYAQPQLVSEGAGIQGQRANFDLAEYNATQPTYLEPQQDNILPALIGAAGTIGGAYFGGPAGAAAGGALAKAYTSQNSPDYLDYYLPQGVRRRGTSPIY